jgi:hypothetical protein
MVLLRADWRGCQGWPKLLDIRQHRDATRESSIPPATTYTTSIPTPTVISPPSRVPQLPHTRLSLSARAD